MLKTIRSIIISLMVFVSLVLGLLGYKIYGVFQYVTPEKTNMVVTKGMSVKEIARQLQARHVIQDRHVFEFYLRFVEKDSFVKAGEYEIKKDKTLVEVISQLIKGDVVQYKFTIPEGYALKEICKIFESKNIMTTLRCEELSRETAVLNMSPAPETLEGYIFPETYLYQRDTKPEILFQSTVKMFFKQTGGDFEQKAKEKGLTLHEAVTLASIIEKETGVAAERGLISGVFHNRLKKGMLLQSDPTVIYGIKTFDGNLRKKDLETDTPYNTYTRTGLPKGPICSPGLSSLIAAVSPQQTNSLYFVAKGDGSHYFSDSIQEHNNAVRYYQLKRGSEPEKDKKEPL